MPACPLILAAEDNPADQFLLDRAMQRAGLHVRLHFVNDGRETIQYLQSTSGDSPPDLMLLDLNMPGTDGFEVLEWLRRYPEARPGYVVVLSASCFGRDLQRARLLGVDHYLVKPADPMELVATVKRLEPYWAERQHRVIPVSAGPALPALAAA